MCAATPSNLLDVEKIVAETEIFPPAGIINPGCPAHREAVAELVAKVQKADRHAEARKILRALQDDPAACIIG
jgi:NADH:ubiquinone oxidoreductase subunit B-like Fe-S oxidoreductase